MGSPDSRNQFPINFLLNQKIFTLPIRDVPEYEYRVCKGNYLYYGTHKGNKYEMGGKNIFLSQLFRWVIIPYINCGHQGAIINMRGIYICFIRS